MLVGRDAERARLRKLLAAARRGRSGVLVVSGEAGIGKSSLLADAERAARGMTVLRATGVPAEASLPYAGLTSLVRPVLDHVDELPPAQASALRSAIALSDGVTDPLAVCAASLGVLSVAAERRPVAVLVDDAHWLDSETAQVVGFVARRLLDEPAALIVALRDGESSALDLSGVDELTLGGLAPDDAASLLDGRVSPPVARRLADETEGNPLALLELADLLSADQRSGLEELASPLPVGPRLHRAFGRRLAALSGQARLALTVAAAAGARNEVSDLTEAWNRLGLGPDPAAAAERAGLVSVAGGRLRFRHPLVRAAAYSTAEAPDRRAAHAALASSLGASAEDERAWHRALAATAPDEEVAAELEAVGRRAAARSLEAAGRALEQSAALTPAGSERTRRLLAAAALAADAGTWDRAAALLDGIGPAAGPADVELLFLRGLVESNRRVDALGADLLEDAAAALESTDRERAATALVQAATTRWFRGDFEGARAAAVRAAAIPLAADSATRQAVAMSLGDTAGWLGHHEEAAREWRRAAELVDPDDPQRLQTAGEALFSAGDDPAAQDVLRRAERLARDRGSLGSLTLALQILALSQARSGALAAAHADALEAVRLMEALGRRGELASALVNLAWLEAMLGREEDCRAHVAEARALWEPVAAPVSRASSALALLELSLGRPELAAVLFDGVLESGSRRIDAEPVAPRPVLPSLVEALVRAGRADEARDWLGGRLELARKTGRADAIAPLLRASALVDADEAAYREALAWHERWSNRFEHARTQLCYGELLRRAKRRAEARVQLRAAVEGFDAVGARLWSARARAELAATGEHARRRDPSTVDELTPQELTVARLVATGLTNREVARRLFLSPKTIETHLGHVFRKTSVRTRAELAHRFRDLPDSMRSRPS